MTDDLTNEAALRAFLLDLLTVIPTDMLATTDGRETIADTYVQQAERAHPAVAEVLRKAAEIVRGE